MTAGGVLAEADTVARLEGLLAQALEANKRLTVLAERQRAEIVGLRASLVARDAELERVNAELTVLKADAVRPFLGTGPRERRQRR